MSSDGMTYAPKGKPNPVVEAGEFPFAATNLDHGHIYGMCNGLTEAGANLKWVFDPDDAKVDAFRKSFPDVHVATSLDQILDDPDIKLVAAAAIPNQRGPLGEQVMRVGKDYFTDKTPFTSLTQLESAQQTTAQTGQKYMVYYSERLHVECAVFAGDLINDGVIGQVINVIGTGPHRLGKTGRPDWFFNKEQYGGILCDIGSHQIEQFLFFSGATDAKVTHAHVANFNNADTPELEDFGEANLLANNGATNHFRVDWFTPDGLSTWGDGRTFILGTKGYIELRKYVNVGTAPSKDHLFLVTQEGEQHMELSGKVGFPFFGALILDCLNRSETAMTQKHAFKAAELCLKAQAFADTKE
ncbi:MAG: Gfo/Idh/MocA family oxidoreductase [Deinococcota bacterium]